MVNDRRRRPILTRHCTCHLSIDRTDQLYLDGICARWDRLARWFYVHRLAHPNVRWMVQVPRLYHIYRKIGTVDSFEVRALRRGGEWSGHAPGTRVGSGVDTRPVPG